MPGLSLDPSAAMVEHTLTTASFESMAPGQGQTTKKHPASSNYSSQTSWVSAVLECGCLVTRVPSSAGLYCQEMRSLPGSPTLNISSDKSNMNNNCLIYSLNKSHYEEIKGKHKH